MGHAVPLMQQAHPPAPVSIWAKISSFLDAVYKYNNTNLIKDINARIAELDAKTDAELAEMGMERADISRVIVKEFINED